MNTQQTKHRMLAFAIGILWGTLGMHQFYLNRNANGFGYIGFGFTAWLFIGLGVATLSGELLAIGLIALMLIFIILIIDLARLLILSDESFDDIYN